MIVTGVLRAKANQDVVEMEEFWTKRLLRRAKQQGGESSSLLLSSNMESMSDKSHDVGDNSKQGTRRLDAARLRRRMEP